MEPASTLQADPVTAKQSDSEFFKSIGLDLQGDGRSASKMDNEAHSEQAAKSSTQSDANFFKALGIDPNSKPAGEPNADKPLTSMLPTNLTLLTLSGASVLLGFFGALAFAKKREGATLDKALLPRRGMSESGTKLAFRALGWGTFYAVSGFAVVTYGLYEFTKYRLKQFEQRIKDNQQAKLAEDSRSAA